MSAQRLACAVVAMATVCLTLIGGGRPVRAEEKRVVDQLLDILRQNKQITDQQYRELKRKADQEREEDLRKSVAAPAPVPVVSPTVAVAAAAPSPAPSPPPGEVALRSYFKNGWNLESADGNFKVAIGGFTQVDWAVTDPSTPVKQEFRLTGTGTGVEFRRSRLSLAGLVFGNIDFKFEYDFAEQGGGQPSFKDVYIGMSQIPVVQYLRVGHFKEPFSLEELTPDTYTTFQERALPNAFAQPGSNIQSSGGQSSGTDRNTGFTIYQTYFDQRMTFATGAFRATDNFGDGFGTDSPYDVAARVTGLPAYEVGDNLVHLGFSYNHKFRHYSGDSHTTNEGQETIQFLSRPESHLFPANLVNTGPIRTNGADVINPELAFVRGPVAIQGEYSRAFVNQASKSCTTTNNQTTCTTLPGISNPDFDGFYIEGSYFLTGESRASYYRTQFGHFERVTPKNNFSIDGSHWGAWQVAARFSRLDLDTSAIKQVAGNPSQPTINPPLGALDDITGGVNWYLNPVMRITVNYVWAHLEGVGDSNIAEGRFQLAF